MLSLLPPFGIYPSSLLQKRERQERKDTHECAREKKSLVTMASIAQQINNILATSEDEEVPPALESHKTSTGEIIGRLEVPDDASKVMKGGEAAAAKDYANYFCSYAFLYHQKQMLTDQHRMQSYHAAVLKNRSLFEGKTVVDVGTGSGVLSVWSGQAGAAKVWAVEFTDMAKHAVQLVKHNGLADVVTVVKGAVEELDLPAQSVDIMISEWMGYFLLRESMLDSLIRARDRFLKPGGVMMPSSATMMWGAINCEDMRLQKVPFSFFHFFSARFYMCIYIYKL
jgi:ubiquinone/menaquinone biosynthesis C-methylase UbiE